MMPDGSWIKVENLKEILSYFQPKIYHPDDPRYQKMWRELRKRCVEGIWVEQFGQYRYVPGRLGFFGVFTRFEDWDENKNRVIRQPKVRDLEWHRAYYRLEMDGFSGWSDDDKYTSDALIFEVSKEDNHYNLSENRKLALFKSDGSFKEYIPPRENIFMLHDKPKGVPLYYNHAKNAVELGSRGGGKSYFAALGEILPDLCFDAQRYYDPGQKITTKAVIEVTEGGGGKAVELLEKAEFGMNCLADPAYPELGVWEYSKDEIEPCPFYKKMTGSIKGNNKQNPWIHQYDVKVGNTWSKQGTKARVYNSIYSPNSKAGAQKSAGGRRTFVIHEEIGLTTELIQAWGSNEGMIREGGINKMAGQKGIGTSGNMETIGPAKKIFTHPNDFDCLTFTYREDPDGEYGFFIPSYVVDPKFKDEDGNTDIEAAYREHKKKYDETRETSLPEVFLEYRMNFPLKIEDMWVQGMGELLPVREAEQREKELMKGNLYKAVGKPLRLYWDNNIQGINYDFDTDAQPFYEWPLGTDRKTLNSVFMMYIHPDKLKVNGQIPNDAVFVLHDPYISEEQDKGGSLGAAYFIVNPKYISHGLPGNCIAASIIGKHERGTDGFNEQLELGIHFYGNPVMGLWYEANRGDKLRSYFVKKRKHHLLCLRPQFEQGQWLFNKAATQTGYVVGNRLNRMALIDAFRDWLLEETEIDGELKRNIFRIPCIFLLRQIKQYNLNMNFDAVDAMMGISLAIGEQEHKIINRISNSNTNYAPLKNFIKKKMRV